jgi:methanethiol S-methyltransferase
MVVVRSISATNKNKFARVAVFVYGVFCYVIFLLTFIYMTGFVGNFGVPKSIDSAPIISIEWALLANIGSIGLFGLQHSTMARSNFKTWWTKIVPQQIERSTYVLCSSLCLMALFYFWQPLGIVIWKIETPIFRYLLFAVCGFGWLLVLASTFLINHFDLFGLRQVYLYLRGKEYTPLKFATPGFYQNVRHPLYLGFIIAFWSSPTMTLAHFVFALITAVYILGAIQLEERDLVKVHGKAYTDYCDRTPMLLPLHRHKPSSE